MTHHLRYALACLAIVGLHGLAVAEVPAATAETLMHKSGVWAQLGDVAVQVRAGMAQSVTGAAIGPDDAQRLAELAGEAFAAGRLRDSFLEVVAQQLTPAQSAAALRWYNSPTGQLITRLEEASSANFDDIQRVMADGEQALGRATPRRHALLTQAVQATRAAEGMVTLQINTTLAILQGVANVAPNAATPPAAQLREALEAQRPQMRAAAMGVMLTMFAATYQSASDQALAQYVKFLSSRSGSALSDTMNAALDQALSQAAQRLGSGMVPLPPGATRL